MLLAKYVLAVQVDVKELAKYALAVQVHVKMDAKQVVKLDVLVHAKLVMVDAMVLVIVVVQVAQVV